MSHDSEHNIGDAGRRLSRLVGVVQRRVDRLRRHKLVAEEARRRRRRSASSVEPTDAQYDQAFHEHLLPSIEAGEAEPDESKPPATKRKPRKRQLPDEPPIDWTAKQERDYLKSLLDGEPQPTTPALSPVEIERCFPGLALKECERIGRVLNRLWQAATPFARRELFGQLRTSCRAVLKAVDRLGVRHYDLDDAEGWAGLTLAMDALDQTWSELIDRGILAGDGSGSREPGAGSFIPTDADINILCALAKRKTRVYARSLYVEDAGEDTVKKRLRILEEQGLVDRAEGKRSGWAITVKGHSLYLANHP